MIIISTIISVGTRSSLRPGWWTVHPRSWTGRKCVSVHQWVWSHSSTGVCVWKIIFLYAMYIQSRTEALVFTELQISLIQNIIFMIQQLGMYLLMNSNMPALAVCNWEWPSTNGSSSVMHRSLTGMHSSSTGTERESSFSCPFVEKKGVHK